MTRQELFAWCMDQYGTEPEYPWRTETRPPVTKTTKNGTEVILETGKNKLGIPGEGTAELLNVKCDPVLAASCRTQPGFFPAWHMNKEKWLSILLNEPELDTAIKNLLALSFDLTSPSSRPRHSK